ncbi:saccharopine dehydrogenase family protein [Pseudomonas sp. EL_65y_Pfl2_R95]|uniref:saccharopine dehydrogenase family protein n=1 Tax=Pseudomonas sp. EL_65y_Pfl2_R95 TaxID=3088698 RepID=UPI0030D9648B
MTQAPKVLIYGGSGYTGKLIAEALARREIPFYFAGRTRAKLEAALKIVEERRGSPVNAEIVTANNTVEELLPLLREVDVVINVAGPFMQIAWPVVEACLEAGCHYMDTTGEQDWTAAIADKFGDAFAAKQLLLAPATSFMWASGAMAAEVVLENPEIDSLDILYQIDNGLPSEASTKSFLRMACNDTSQYYLEQKQLKAWPNDVAYDVQVPYRNAKLRALPWGGACEPIWFSKDERVLNCKVLTAIGEHLVDGVLAAINAFNAVAPSLSQEEREAWTNQMGDQMDTGEPPKDDLDVQRGVIVVHGQGRQTTSTYVMNLSAAYSWTGEICAESAERLLNGQLKNAGFQSSAKAFGHRELISAFHKLGYCSALPDAK